MNTQAVDPQKLDRYECPVCGYVYEPDKGDTKSQIDGGTSFEELPSDWRCPVCGAAKSTFSNIGPAGNPSGFKENLAYGLGVNTLTSGQKNLLIFGLLALSVLFMLSFYAFQ